MVLQISRKSEISHLKIRHFEFLNKPLDKYIGLEPYRINKLVNLAQEIHTIQRIITLEQIIVIFQKQKLNYSARDKANQNLTTIKQ
ncbi:hypothetical protein BpHYR1_035642 [Brachionus plicatilis]|uniref:Uncharacterized protein n=1 Tax=Brachionus plicatilis TaxID=10195 RepID=A0A3M7RQC6_BRAPC|nr:hypothetical protein BpHYR1_035642 [Brachionus plicatilis]